jgi:hypothetical protein
MTITISIFPKAEARLKQQAGKSRNVSLHAAELIEQAVTNRDEVATPEIAHDETRTDS